MSTGVCKTNGSLHTGGVPLGDHLKSRELQMTGAVVVGLLVVEDAEVDIEVAVGVGFGVAVLTVVFGKV